MLENQKLKRQVAQIEDICKVDIDWQPMFSVSQRPLPVHRRIQMRTASPKSRHELFIGTYNKISFEGVLKGNLVLLKVNMSTSFPSSYFVAR